MVENSKKKKNYNKNNKIMIGDKKMGLFNLFGGKKTVELDKVKSDENKNRMREIFDKQVDNGSEYKIVYAYSEDIGGANFAVLRTVSYKYRSFILGYKEEKEIQNTLRTLQGMECLITLSDGTRVHLNAETRLTYPVCFSSKERIVQIEGEAYFDVAPDKEHPFIVKTSHTSIRVTGTSFNVRAYADEDTESTTLISGTVRINSGNEEFELVPNQHYTYNKNTGTNTVANVNTDLYTSWESGSFIFLNVPLENVMSYLSKWYGFQYSFEDEAAKQVRIGAYLNRYANMNPIIDMITELNLVNIKQREGILHISYKQ